MNPITTSLNLSNAYLSLTVSIQEERIFVQLTDLSSDFSFAEGPYFYRASVRHTPTQLLLADALEAPLLELHGRSILVRGQIAGLIFEQCFSLPEETPCLCEQISLTNGSGIQIDLEDFACGMQRQMTDRLGRPLPELQDDHFQAVPFLHRPTDSTGYDNDYSVTDLLNRTGSEVRLGQVPVFVEYQGGLPSMHRHSEGWAWLHGGSSLLVFKFNQQYIEFSVLAVETDDFVARLRLGGIAVVNGEPTALRRILPGQRFEAGETHYELIAGGYTQAAYAFRKSLDEQGCRFPPGFNPPVHWNELYDNPEWNLGSPGRPVNRSQNHGPLDTRPQTYTRALILQEAEKARRYSCESLYLDPGWDTVFGTFLWGEGWLGECKDFVDQVHRDYGLKVSLHCPLATWMSFDGRSVDHWPQEALRMDARGELIPGSICLGARQYLAEAEKRLLTLCQAGVSFLMFDGNWYNDGCWNPNHGHTIPYTYEAHCRANLDLAQRIHAHFPQVLIEMHDMISGGSIMRYTPVYYKYGLPGSYDTNWGFELMWQPMEDILSGRARSLYYYNLACNVPAYLHVDLRDDNEHCLVLWWYASTCRHLGIGGTHENPRIAHAQQQAMQRYLKLDRFYKRGEFYGLGEEIHLHVLREEGAFVVNLFNLSDDERIISGSVRIADLGLNPDQWFVLPKSAGFDSVKGIFHIQRRLQPWSAQVAEVRPLEAGLLPN